MGYYTTKISTKFTVLLPRMACLPIPNAMLLLLEPAAKRLQLTLHLTLTNDPMRQKEREQHPGRVQAREMVRPLGTLRADITGGIALVTQRSVRLGKIQCQVRYIASYLA